MYAFYLRGKTYVAHDFEKLSAIYCRLRDESGEGASTFQTPEIYEDETEVARFSYNGKIWKGENVIYNPY